MRQRRSGFAVTAHALRHAQHLSPVPLKDVHEVSKSSAPEIRTLSLMTRLNRRVSDSKFRSRARISSSASRLQIRNYGSSAVAEHDLGHRAGALLLHVLRRDGPRRGTLKHQGNSAPHQPWIHAHQHVAPNLEGLWSLRHIPHSHVGHPEDAALFLDRPAVRDDTPRVLLEINEVEESKWWEQSEQLVVHPEAEVTKSVLGMRVEAHDDGCLVVSDQRLEPLEQPAEPLAHLNVLGAVDCSKEVFLRLHPETLDDIARIDALPVRIQHLVDRIPDDKNAFALDPLAEQILLRPMRVWHQHRAAVIDDAAVDLLRDPIVVATVPRLPVGHPGPLTRPHDTCQTAVRIPRPPQTPGPSRR